jgi:hypothetical protein
MVVLCIQDTTELDFNGQEIEGLGPLNYEARHGMFAHPTCAGEPGREPLGMLDAWMRHPRRPARRKAGAGWRATSVSPSRRWKCRAPGWCTWPTAKRTFASAETLRALRDGMG